MSNKNIKKPFELLFKVLHLMFEKKADRLELEQMASSMPTESVLVNNVLKTFNKKTTENGDVYTELYSIDANMVGASAENAGMGGMVPPPAAGDNEKFLSGDGRWKIIEQKSDKYIASYRIISELDTNTHTLELKYNDGNVLSVKLPKMGIDIDRVVKFGTEDPTGETIGQTKQLYVNTATGRMWVCENGNMMPMHWIGLSGAGSTDSEIEDPSLGSGGAVLYTPQGLTEEQQTQARANIGAAKLNSDDETIEMLIEADMLPAVTTPSGAILTDNSGNVILRY